MHYSLAARDVTEERNFYLKNRDNDEQIRKANEEIQRYETELQYLMDRCDMRVWKATFRHTGGDPLQESQQYERKMSLAELRHFLHRQ